MTPQGRSGGPQRPVKGFRPGKEPPQIKKQRAKEQFGEVSARQERLIEMLAERSPEEGRRMLRRWRIGLLAVGIILAVLGGLLFTWSLVAGAIAEILAVVAMVLWWRSRRQRDALEAMVDAVAGRSTGKGGKSRGSKK